VRVFVLSSGSSGNAMLLEANDGARVIVDAGLGPRVLTERLRLLGADLFPRRVDAIVLTHHHGDHFAHAEPLARALKAPLFLHAGISARRVRSRWEVREYDARAPFVAGGFEVRAMHVPHDAPQVALSFTSSDDERFGVATDLGHVPPALAPFLGACDAALLEANYCPAMLADGPYPPHLKQRIRGGFGHLANEQTADLAARLVGTRLGALYLGHLSRANNTPARALEVVVPRCAGLAVRVVDHGVSRVIDVVKGSRAYSRGEQLALALA
jgi:phosphoribosyl 1,2-cyclic phosphodiesterase